ncbi:hypothetical protein MMC25_005409 [Agyrium rufum]|nr:hypothetical protein [Agyrium rufum]
MAPAAAANSQVPAPLPPIETISPTDRGGLVFLLTTLLLTFVVIAFFVRFYTRRRISGPWSRDDDFLTAATFVCCAQSAVVFFEVHKGFGQVASNIEPKNLPSLGKAVYASDVLYIIALYFAKCSVAYLFLRITPYRSHSIASWGSIVLTSVWAVASICLITIQCNPTHPLQNLDGQCKHLFVRWAIIGGFDIFTEIVLFSLAVYMVANLQMGWKAKATIILVFSSRLPVIAAAAMRLRFLQIQIPSMDPTFAGALTAVWTQIELNYSIMASTLPCLGPFITPFSSSYRPSRPGNTSSQRSAGEDFSMHHNLSRTRSEQKVDKDQVHASAREITNANHSSLRPEQLRHEVKVTHGQKVDQASVKSDDSRQMIIKKNIEFSVDRN